MHLGLFTRKQIYGFQQKPISRWTVRRALLNGLNMGTDRHVDFPSLKTAIQSWRVTRLTRQLCVSLSYPNGLHLLPQHKENEGFWIVDDRQTLCSKIFFGNWFMKKRLWRAHRTRTTYKVNWGLVLSTEKWYAFLNHLFYCWALNLAKTWVKIVL